MTTKQHTLQTFLAGVDYNDPESQQIIRDELNLCYMKLNWLRQNLKALSAQIGALIRLAKENAHEPT